MVNMFVTQGYVGISTLNAIIPVHVPAQVVEIDALYHLFLLTVAANDVV